MNYKKQALLVLDMMNEIVRADGAWAEMGYGYGPRPKSDRSSKRRRGRSRRPEMLEFR